MFLEDYITVPTRGNMVDKAPILGNLALNRLYKFLVYLGSILIISSLFFEVKQFDVHILRQISYQILLVGIILWFSEEVFNKIQNFFEVREEVHEMSEHEVYDIFTTIWWLKFIVYVLVLVIGFLNVKSFI